MPISAQDELDALLRIEGEITMEEEKKEQEVQYKMRPCPFCGNYGTELHVYYGRVRCKFCKAEGPQMPNEELAVAFWNKQVKWKTEEVHKNPYNGQ